MFLLLFFLVSVQHRRPHQGSLNRHCCIPLSFAPSGNLANSRPYLHFTRCRKTLVSKWSHVCSLLLILPKGKETNHHFSLGGHGCSPALVFLPSQQTWRPEQESELGQVQTIQQTSGDMWAHQPRTWALCPMSSLVQLKSSWTWAAKSRKQGLSLWLGGLGANPAATQLTGWAKKAPSLSGPQLEATGALARSRHGCWSAQAALETSVWSITAHTTQCWPQAHTWSWMFPWASSFATSQRPILSESVQAPSSLPPQEGPHKDYKREKQKQVKETQENIFYNPSGEMPFQACHKTSISIK